MTKAEAMAAALNEFLDVSWEVEAAAVVSPDGLPMASALPPDVEEDRLAAMSASLLTLGERAAHNLNRGDLSQVLVEGERGYVLLMAAGPSAVLVAVTSHDAKVGLVLFEMRKAVESIAAVMDGSFRATSTVTPETEIIVDAGGATSTGVPPPAPPERVWLTSSTDWQSGTPEPQPITAEGSDAGSEASADDTVGTERPGTGEFSVPDRAAADPAAWDPQDTHDSPGPAGEDAPEEHSRGDKGDEPASEGWHTWRRARAEELSRETTEPAKSEPEGSEPAESESAPSWT